MLPPAPAEHGRAQDAQSAQAAEDVEAGRRRAPSSEPATPSSASATSAKSHADPSAGHEHGAASAHPHHPHHPDASSLSSFKGADSVAGVVLAQADMGKPGSFVFRDDAPNLGPKAGAGEQGATESAVPGEDATCGERLRYALRPVPDGLRAWLVTLGAFFALFASLGTIYALGIFLPVWEQDPDFAGYSRADLSLPATLQLAFFYVGGIFAGSAADRFGPRRVIALGTAVWFPGIMLGSVCTSMWQLDITLGFMAGIGSGLVCWTCFAAPAQWFFKYRASGVSLATVGSAIGNLALGYGGQGLIVQHGWRNTLQIIGGIGLACLVLAIALVGRRLPRTKRTLDFGTAFKLVRTDRYYIYFLLGSALFQFVFFVPFEHLPSYAIDLGFSANFAGLAVAMLGTGSAVGRLLLGPLGDFLGRYRVFHWSVLLSAVCMVLWPSCTTESSILAFAFFYPWFAGGLIATFPVVAADQWGLRKMAPAMSLLSVAMIPGAVASGTLAGYAHDRTGSYTVYIYISAGIMFLVALIFFQINQKTEKPEDVESPRRAPAEPRETPVSNVQALNLSGADATPVPSDAVAKV